MNETMSIIGLLVVFAFILVILPRVIGRLIGKGVGAAMDVGQKALFKKQIAESDDLIDVPLVLTSPAAPDAILAALDAIIHPSKEPPGFGAILYEVSREPMRIVYGFGSKLQPQQLVTELRLSEQDGKTEIVFRVLTAMRTDNVFICKTVLLRLREQVQYVAECGDDPAKLAEGAHIYRALEPEVAKRTNAIFRMGAILTAAAVIWLSVGIEVELLPVWLLLAAAAGVLVYIGRKPVAKRQHESSAEAARVLHPGLAQDAAPQVASQAAVAVGEVAVVAPAVAPAAPATPGAPSPSGPGLVARFKAMPQQAKLVVVGGTVVTVLLVVIVVLLSTGNSRNPYADQSDVYLEEDYSYEGDEVSYEGDGVAVEADPGALSPDTHARVEDDLLGSAPSDGSMEFSDVVFVSGRDQEDGTLDLEFTLVSRSPAEWYIAFLRTDMGYYIDYDEVSMSEFLDAINGTGDAKGMIVFNDQAVYELHVSTRGQKASASTPEKDQVTVVPELMTLDLPYAEWEGLEFGEALAAHDAAVKQAFADVGLIAVLKRVPVTDGSEPTQDPRAGSTVPVGTKVYITIPSSD